MSFLLEMMRLGLANLRLHLLRSILTALGIILGVASVITMVSLGEGQKRDALLQIERFGARNVIVRSQKPPESAAANQQQQSSFISRFGLTREDLEVIRSNFPDAEQIVPLKEVGGQILRDDKRLTSQAFGTTPDFLRVANLSVARGRYLTQVDMDERAMVCVIGTEIANKFFSLEDPLGSTLRIDQKAFTVVGVLAPVGLAGGAGAALVGRDLNLDIHIPLSTARSAFSDLVLRSGQGSFQGSEVQVSELYIASPSRERVLVDAARIRRILEHRHPRLTDIGIIVPYELLENARKVALTYTLVFGAIASIALLVGGIGIMNIMLASVTERTREIGIRRAVGATRSQIQGQFLVETGVLSGLGGVIGVFFGLGTSFFLAKGVPLLPKLPLIGGLFPKDAALSTAVTPWSIVVAFVVAVTTGVVFGIYPARSAAKKDPIEALRHE